MSLSQAPENLSHVHYDLEDVFLHLKEIIIDFGDNVRPNSDLVVKFQDRVSLFKISKAFKNTNLITWELNIYVKSNTAIVVTISKQRFNKLFEHSIATFSTTCNSEEFGDNKIVELKDRRKGPCVRLVFATSKPAVEVASALGTQATSALASKVSMLEKLGKVLEILDVVMIVGDTAQLNPTAQLVVPIVTKVLNKFREIPECHVELIGIMNDLVSIVPILRRASEHLQDPECQKLVKNFITFVKDTSEDIIWYASGSNAEMVVRNWYRSKKDDVKKLRDRSAKLKQNLDLALDFDIQKRASDIQAGVSEIRRGQIEITLGRIKPPKLSSYDLQRCCLQGTRTSVINAVMFFALSNDQSLGVYWLYGIAGSGKSFVATSVAKELDNRKQLSGSFFCKRDVPELRDPSNLIRALAYAIAESHSSYRNVLVGVLKGDSRLEDKALAHLFVGLLKNPLCKISRDKPSKSVIFIIDALDDLEYNNDGISISNYLAEIVGLAPWLRLIITSRPIPVIKNGLQRIEQRLCMRDLLKDDAHDDIVTFVRTQFELDGPLQDLQPQLKEEQLEALAQKSSGLFIWVATVLSYISQLALHKYAVLCEILSSDYAPEPEAQLDALYFQVLHRVARKLIVNREPVKYILALIYVTVRNRSLSSDTLHAFISKGELQISKEELDHLLQQMGSVLTIDTRTGVIRVCHPSFLDFIGQEQRSKDFWTRTEDADAIMAKICFEIMHDGLRFNICGLESSCLRNDEVPDLMERVARHVSPELQYSCMYWLDHLSKSDDAFRRNMQSDVQKFLGNMKSFYWLEVLSLMSKLKAADVILRNLYTMYKDNTELRDAVSDYHCFVTLFHDPISISTPHIYTTAALWTPSSSAISNIHATNLKSHALVLEGRHKVWPASLLVIECKEEVTCITYLSDESRIASGFKNGAIRIWDALSGAPIGAPLVGHTSTVWSVSCSQEGSRIASGSEDRTIRIWDTQSGSAIASPIAGHAGPVRSVAYSRSGTRIVSGSWDRTVRIWNGLTGAVIGTVFVGHTAPVHAVAYSPDEKYIASGSWDRTIRIWDIESGKENGQRLIGHTSSVCSVSYSPNGSRIVSGAEDRTIRIWDSQDRVALCEPLVGHIGPINSVAFSSDEARIISSSQDNSVRIWDAPTGSAIGMPLMGHTNVVSSAAGSPDGSRIISGSADRTIRIWDTQSSLSICEPVQKHTGSIWSVAYSSDGTRIISGSADKTICVWDALTGSAIGTPLVGHNEEVCCSIACSADGSHMIFGSSDGTVRIRNVQSGALMCIMLEGHKGCVRPVAYSIDSKRIIAGLEDNSIRIWDVHSGASIGHPLAGHTSTITSVAYSFKGSYIVSGSENGSICIWDTRSSKAIVAPLVGHTGPVNSVACSRDESRMISGSSDGTIRIWNLRTAALIDEPLEGHIGPVISITYSSDSTRILSGSEDSTIRIWDAQNGTLIGHPLVGHAGPIMSVTYSPDGSRIASCSSDGTVRVWDARTEDRTASDKPVGDDGWIRNPDGGLLLWVPRDFRKGVCDMSLFSLPRDAVGHPIKVDWEKLREAQDLLNTRHHTPIV